MDRGHADRRGMKWTYCGMTSFDGLEAWNRELRGCIGSCLWITVDDRDQLDIVPGLLELAVHPEMVAPEGSRSDDRDTQWMCGWHYFAGAGASTA